MGWQRVFCKAAEGSFPTDSEIRNLKLIILEDQRDAVLKSRCFNRRAESIFGVSVTQLPFVSCCAFMASLLLAKTQIQRVNKPESTKIFFLSRSKFSLW